MGMGFCLRQLGWLWAIQPSQQAQVGVLKTVRFLGRSVWARAVPVMPMNSAAPGTRRRSKWAVFKRVLPDRYERIVGLRRGRRPAASFAPGATAGPAAR